MYSNHRNVGYGNIDFQEDDFEYPPEKADIAGNYKEALKKFICYGHGGGDGAEVLERFISATNEPNTKKTETTRKDQKLHAHLRSCRNTVPVPDLWCEEEEDLQKKRGMKKRPYELPDFISATGIEKIRQAHIEKERSAGEPVMGAMDIGYSVLHDAFFKYQTKPKLTAYGELYNEGDEFMLKTKKQKPTSMSTEKIETDEGAHSPVDVSLPYSHENTVHIGWRWGELEEEESEEEDLGDGLEAIDDLSGLPEPLEKPLYQVPEETRENVVIFQEDKSDGEDISLTPEDLNDLNHIVDVLAAKYEAKEESKDDN